MQIIEMRHVVYHIACLNKIYRKADAAGEGSNESYATRIIKVQAFNELHEYIEDHRGSETVLSMTHLTAFCDRRLTFLSCPQNHGHTT